MTTSHRLAGPWVAVACWLTLTAANAQNAALLQQSFASGLAGFTAAGPVTTGTTGAVMKASALSSDGAITSPAISTAGYTGITVSYDRVTAGLYTSVGDTGIFEYRIGNGTYTRLESTTNTTPGRVTFALPSAAANSTVTLRFRIAGVSAKESFTVNHVTVTGTTVGTGSAAKAPPVGEFTTFESGHVRPMALSKDGTRLYVVNTPDARVEVYDVSGTTPVLKESITVGMEPVALALAPNGQLWVVNHLSDSVSVVDLNSTPARVVNTLYTGDEPRDIVFAGPNNRWAFITAAHRGQNIKFDPQLSKGNVGRADVWVFDANNPGTAVGGTPTTVLNMFGDTLRGLARNADGSRVYTAVFNSGNRTTVLMGGPQDPLAKAGPTKSADGYTAPNTGLIVQKDPVSGNWYDHGDPKTGVAPKVWNNNVKLNLPDYDVFTIDTMAAVPVVIQRTAGVGTTLFNLAVNPTNGKVYVSNQEARNVVRFEGPGKNSSTVNGNFVESRITVIDGATVLPRHLNKHITSYGNGTVGTAAEKAASLATPLEMAVSPDGATMYLAAMGSNKLARFSTAQLEGNSFTPSASSHLLLSGGLPTGVVLDPSRARAFVTTRLDNGISVVNTDSFTETAHVKMFNPEPADVVKGRKFLYDAAYTSSRGDSSCAGCHIFGDMDHLAWDLGNPDEVRTKNTNPYSTKVPAILRTMAYFHPMKGPMTTQSFRGMAGNGPMHWRGDRTGQSTGDTLEERSFKDFSVAFPGLLGRSEPLSDEEMTSFAKFVLKMQYPPNPIAPLDNVYTGAAKAGQTFYMNNNADTIATCNGCHVLDASKNRYGTDGTMAFEGPTIAENFKIPQLRNMYQKVGFFSRNLPRFEHTGDQIRGFGYSLDGVQGSVSSFLDALVFIQVSQASRDNLEAFNLAFPSNLDPIVGQQLTVTPSNSAQTDVVSRLNLLVSRAKVTAPRAECELVVKGVLNGTTRGWVHARSTDQFVSDRSSDAALTLSSLLTQAKAANAALTFTCAAPGNGTRLGIDRNADGKPDGV